MLMFFFKKSQAQSSRSLAIASPSPRSGRRLAPHDVGRSEQNQPRHKQLWRGAGGEAQWWHEWPV